MNTKLTAKARSTTAGVMHSISAAEFSSFVKHAAADTKALFHVAQSNVKTLLEFSETNKRTHDANDSYVLATYAKGDTIVDFGKIDNGYLRSHENFAYAYVPLGFIIDGEVIVQKGGKATKKLSHGDFIGLFETSDWIVTRQTRQIGDWILIANAETKIVYIGASVLNGSDRNAEILRKYLVELARADRVPQPITTLPLLDWVASHTTKSRLPDYAIVAHTHLLPNNLPFFRHLAHLVGFGKIFILEKPYSTVRETYNELVQAGCEVIPVHMEPGMPYEFSVQKSLHILWSKVIEEQRKSNCKNLLIIDDGGDIWLSLPWDAVQGVSIAGVEQTQRGIMRITNSSMRIPPIVSVASSGIKKLIESQFIAQSIIKKLKELGFLSAKKKIGILGAGSIGSALLGVFEKSSVESYYYEANAENKDRASNFCASIDMLFNSVDVVIGTTGTDALKGVALERISGKKVLASASSADVEFASLLKLAPFTSKPFETRNVRIHNNLEFDILNGGYPLNFDRTKDATPSEDIVLTRCLMYIAAMQAVTLITEGKQEGRIYNIDRLSQKRTLERWIETRKAEGNPPPESQTDVKAVLHYSGYNEAAGMHTVWQE